MLVVIVFATMRWRIWFIERHRLRAYIGGSLKPLEEKVCDDERRYILCPTQGLDLGA